MDSETAEAGRVIPGNVIVVEMTESSSSAMGCSRARLPETGENWADEAQLPRLELHPRARVSIQHRASVVHGLDPGPRLVAGLSGDGACRVRRNRSWLVVWRTRRPWQFAPDGRIFVCEQGGTLRVIKNGALLPTPFVTVTRELVRRARTARRRLRSERSRPNRFVYVYYTATSPADPQPRQPLHRQRRRRRGRQRTGAPRARQFEQRHEPQRRRDCTSAPTASCTSRSARTPTARTRRRWRTCSGKMLRINTDGTIPTDNPFYSTATGKNRAIWALGLRNPFTFAFQPRPGRMFINDVGQNTWEEINDGIAGANYGWPDTKGPTTDPRVRGPIHAYGHGSSSTTGCAITGGAFYNPTTAQFPADYVGRLFFADYCGGWIRKLDPSTGNAVTGFATGVSAPVDLKVADDGSSVLPRARRRRTTAASCIRYGTLRRASRASGEPDRSRGRVGHVQRRARRARRRCGISGSATVSTSPAPRRRTTRSRPSQPADNGARFRARGDATTSAASPATRRR